MANEIKLGTCDKKQYEHFGLHERVTEHSQSLPPYPCVNWTPFEKISERLTSLSGETKTDWRLELCVCGCSKGWHSLSSEQWVPAGTGCMSGAKCGCKRFRPVPASSPAAKNEKKGHVDTPRLDCPTCGILWIKESASEDWYAVKGAATPSTPPSPKTQDDMELYIRDLNWSVDAKDYEKSLVAGNIRAFYAHLRDSGALLKPSPERVRLNQYGLTPNEWDTVVKISSALHNKLMEEPEGEDHYDGQSLSIVEAIAHAFKKGTPND